MPPYRSKLAAIQMASGPNVRANLGETERLIQMAVEAGAALVALPENFAQMPLEEGDRLAIAEDEGAGPIQDFLRQQAKSHGIWLIGGTLPLRTDDTQRVRASCLVYNDQGERVARYDKIHLFDVALEEEQYTESALIENGNETVVIPTPFGRLGIAVCYDLRFPEMFRIMVNHGAELFVIPSAFTAYSGKAHWEVLVRARAIENLVYVIAPDQGGYHVNGRETHGDSMIVNPWGEVLDRLSRGSGVVMAEHNQEYLSYRRSHFPALQHRRFFFE